MKSLQKDKLHVYICKDRKEMGAMAAKKGLEFLRKLLDSQEEVNAIFAAAPSQMEMFNKLVQEENLEWNRVNAFHMDNYIGLADDAPQQFSRFLKDHLFSKLNLKNIYYLGNRKEDAEKYAALLATHKPDICFMGIGENGHIAFNDPINAYFDDKKTVKVVELDNMCRQQQVNEKLFDTFDDVPTHAITLTIPTLMKSRHIICTVPGKNKAKAAKNMLEGPISEDCPASILREHNSAYLFLDEYAAGILKK
jgi:glucosamine-6-phosphate deaminase